MAIEIVIAVIAGGLILFGVHLWLKGNHLVLHGEKTEGFVFANVYKGDPLKNSRGVYFPVVRFVTKQDEWITKQYEIGYNPPLKEGKKLKIIYDPEDPEYYQIDNRFLLEILPRILVAIGLIEMILSLLYYLEYR